MLYVFKLTCINAYVLLCSGTNTGNITHKDHNSHCGCIELKEVLAVSYIMYLLKYSACLSREAFMVKPV